MSRIARIACLVICTLAVGAPPVFATAPNTSVAGIVSYEVNQGWVTHYFDETTTTRWFSFGETGGHSYCIEAVQGPFSAVQLDPNLTAYTDATGATALSVSGVAVASDNGGGDPYFIKGARACYIAPTALSATTIRGLKINVPISVGSGDAGYVRVRIVDTTLLASAIAISGTADHALISNFTTSAISVSVTCPAQPSVKNTVSIPANTTTFVSPPVTGGNAVPLPCLFAHNGPPDALRGYLRTSDPFSGVTSTLDMRTR